jgi:glycosyltransferase involved in cell wall biosynthesis
VRLLWVTAEPPDRDLGGGNIRQARLLDTISQHYDVDLLLVGELRDERVRRAVHQVREMPAPVIGSMPRWRRRLVNLQLSLGRGGPTERWAHRAPREALRPLIDDSDYAVVVVQHAGLTPLLPARRRARWVAELHNIGSGTADELRRLAPARRHAWVLGRELAAAQRFERWIVGSYDAVVTVSSPDAALLPGPSQVVPNGVDVPESPQPLATGRTVLFSGTLGYRPNVDGAVWFAEQVWPRVRAAVPDARWDVVGRAPVEQVRALNGLPGVRVHADVPAMAPYLRAARVCVVPLRFGTGTRLKALEAWASARPVVATTTGLAGLDVEPGRDAVVTDDPEEMAREVVRLLTDDEAAMRLAGNGYDLVREKYDWGRIGRTYADFLNSLA